MSCMRLKGQHQPVRTGLGMNGHTKGELFYILLLIPLGHAVISCKAEL